MGALFIIIPAACLLDDLFALLQQLNLTLALALDGAANGLEGVQVLHFSTGTEFLRAHLTDGQVHIRTHGALLELAVRRTQILNDQTQLIQISNDFFRASHIRFGHDLDQRHAASVIIH